ncbi:GTP pyrophosphokinase [Geomicrobium sp. JCM 19037]|uniref:GTP pyrophosphokinase n=1 Tax=Geomicrobium sp. JCM 19037 TaxID=1460634 RepID=UPI00045F36A6|nr:GTP pyrophosphokinase family protein [Geomicrobium sp. JCM 19037]GAK02744.1 GTP pyrophosphokinase [Geomicrobium sp. JCM 19037]
MERKHTSIPIDPARLKMMKNQLTRFLMTYKFALDEMNTKVGILQEEFQYVHEYNPIEHVSSRLKSPESILQKVQRKRIPMNMEDIREHIKDIAGIRISCSFQKDIYAIQDMLEKHEDIRILEVKDYLQTPKPNGYRSLHLIVEVPVYMSDRIEHVAVEIQIRTVAMDFWASLEHKIFYKFGEVVPSELSSELKDVAEAAAKLDRRMESLHQQANEYKKEAVDAESLQSVNVQDTQYAIPAQLIRALTDDDKKNQ